MSDPAVTTSKVLVVKSAPTKPVLPPGNVTLLNKNKSPTSNPCAALLTVTVADPFDDVKVQDVMLSKGVIS